jgi:preprotein translocase subunit SecA
MSMELVERIWESTGSAINGVLGSVERSLTGIFGSANARQVKRYAAASVRITEREPAMMALSDDELAQKTVEFRERLSNGEKLDDLLEEAFAVCREAGRRFMKMRHYDVQLIGGMVLHGGSIAEMITGEGKTLVATLPTYLNALVGSVHVITVNDYLARRDMEWMAPMFMNLGLTVGVIQSGMDGDARQKAYACDITYGTNNEFGFDYLRDNMRIASRDDSRFGKQFQQVQGPLTYAVIDEVDNILIDEARTPLIISGSAHQDIAKYSEADRVARSLNKETHFIVNEKDRNVTLTDDGIREAEKLAGVESFYTAGNMEWPHLIDNALRARFLYKKDVNYVVKDNAIVIVDEFTGRLMEGRQWGDGLHQSVEAKEGVKIKEETQTLATITLQNFFKLYKKISGMTGTAMTEAAEFDKIYGLNVVAIPTNRDMRRLEHPDIIYLTEKEKFEAVADEVERTTKWDVIETKDGNEYWGNIKSETDLSVEFQGKGSKDIESLKRSEITKIEYKGRPVLVGTVSIEKSEVVSAMLERRGIEHQVLNAKNHGREAEIVAQAGRYAAVTIATNMAGRGTDIVLGGNPETMAWAELQDKYETRLDVPKDEWETLVHEIEVREKMKEAGEQIRTIDGLCVIGTERHESRRIDLQLRGRCGRQGDPGSSRFFLSLEDDLMRIFAGDWVRNVMGRLGMGEGEPIESSFVSRRISAAQKKVEERNFEVRKNLLDYDEVMDQQRKRVYSYRQRILDGGNCRELVLEQIHAQIERAVEQFSAPMFGPESYANWAGPLLSCQLDAKDFRSADADQAAFYARDFAERAAETQIMDAIDENLPDSDDESDWNWEALAKWSNGQYRTNFRAVDLKKAGRNDVDTLMVDKANAHIAKIDLDEGAEFLTEDYGNLMLVEWMKNKFLVEIPPEELRDKESAMLSKILKTRAEAAYQDRETQFPVIAGLNRFQVGVVDERPQIDTDGLINWASQRFEDPDLLTSEMKNGDQIFSELVKSSRKCEARADSLSMQAKEKVQTIFAGENKARSLAQATGSNGQMSSLISWLNESLDVEETEDRLAELDREELESRIAQAIDDKFYPEIRRMERQFLLQTVDSAWKDHLLAMDHLRSAIGLSGYAQKDPKVEYKREGMALFEKMWLSLGEQVTDGVFRLKNVTGRDIVQTVNMSQNFVERHDSVESTSDMARRQEDDMAAADRAGTQTEGGETVVKPIRNRSSRPGRNDPCECGSGKKYKNCCLRKRV